MEFAIITTKAGDYVDTLYLLSDGQIINSKGELILPKRQRITRKISALKKGLPKDCDIYFTHTVIDMALREQKFL